MTTMHALGIAQPGPLDQIAPLELPIPEAAAGEVRVRVQASTVSPADLKTLSGQMSLLHGKTRPLVTGYDFSGVIDAVGPGVQGFTVGELVFGFLAYGRSNRQGAHAELVTVAASTIAKKPESVSHATAAASATSALTALQAMRDLGRLRSGGQVMIIGASGGVGTMAIGVARKLGAKVTAVCGTHAVELVKRLGADTVIDRKVQDYRAPSAVRFDVIFDAAAASRWSELAHLLAPGGAYVTTLPSVGFALDKAASLIARTRVGLVMVKPVGADMQLLAQWLGEGMEAPIAASFPVRELRGALARLEHGETQGRIVVQVASGF